MLALARGSSGGGGVALAARTLGRGAARLAHTETAGRDEKEKEEEERAYYERERRRALLTPRGLRRATFGTSLLALGLLPCLFRGACAPQKIPFPFVLPTQPTDCVLRAPARVADTALGLVLPLHAHLGMTSVIEDYATHRPTRTALKAALGLCTAATAVRTSSSPQHTNTFVFTRAATTTRTTQAVGLNFNINGLGIGSALRHMWSLD